MFFAFLFVLFAAFLSRRVLVTVMSSLDFGNICSSLEMGNMYTSTDLAPLCSSSELDSMCSSSDHAYCT